jgi:hypothetical protein
MEPEIQRLVDESAIRGVLSRYVHALDARDWDLLRSCYHVDAREHRSRFDGDVAGFIEWVQAVVAPYAATAHHLTTSTIQVDGDHAVAETYVLACHRMASDGTGSPHDLVVSNRYLDRFERRDRVWRISDRFASYHFGRQDDVALDVAFASEDTRSSPNTLRFEC